MSTSGSEEDPPTPRSPAAPILTLGIGPIPSTTALLSVLESSGSMSASILSTASSSSATEVPPSSTIAAARAMPVEAHPLSPEASFGEDSEAESAALPVRSYFDIKIPSASASASALNVPPSCGETSQLVSSSASSPSVATPVQRSISAAASTNSLLLLASEPPDGLSAALSPPFPPKVPLFPDRPEPPELSLPEAREDYSAGRAALAPATPKLARGGLNREETAKALKRASPSPAVSHGRVLEGGSGVLGEACNRPASDESDYQRVRLKIGFSKPPHLLAPAGAAAEFALQHPDGLSLAAQTSLLAHFTSELAEARRLIAEREAEVVALAGLAVRTYGAGEGEVERCRVRARAEAALLTASNDSRKPWDLDVHVESTEKGGGKARVDPGTGARYGIDLDLQEAMSEDLDTFDTLSRHSTLSEAYPSSSSLPATGDDSFNLGLPPPRQQPGLGPGGLLQAIPTPASKHPIGLPQRLFFGTNSSPPALSIAASSSRLLASNCKERSGDPDQSQDRGGEKAEAGRKRRNTRHSRTGSVSSIASVGSVGQGAGGGWGFRSWKWGSNAAQSGNGSANSPGAKAVAPTGQEWKGKGKEMEVEANNVNSPTEKPARGRTNSKAASTKSGNTFFSPEQAAPDAPLGASIPTMTDSSLYSTSLRSNASSSSPDVSSSASTSPELQSPIEAKHSAIQEPSVNVVALLPPGAVKLPRRVSEMYKSPMTALLSRWTPESSPALTTAAMVHTSFSHPCSAASGSTNIPSDWTKVAEGDYEEEFPHPSHFEAVAQSAAQWVSAAGAMEGLLRDGEGGRVSPRVVESAKGLFGGLAERGVSKWSVKNQGQVEAVDAKAAGPSNPGETARGLMRRVSTAKHEALGPDATVGEAGTVHRRSKSKTKGYLLSAKGTLGRAFGLGGSSPSKGGSTSAVPEQQPNVTVPTVTFRRLGPATSPLMSVVGSQSSGKIAPAASGTRTPAPMELDTIIAPDAKPPTLAVDKASAKPTAATDEPLTDRYGFIVDVKTGVKLMREARRKKSNGAEACEASTPADSSAVLSLASDNSDDDEVQGPTQALPLKSQFDVEAELGSLLEALGLPPPQTEGGPPPSPDGKQTKPIKSGAQPTTQSIRLLLAQLNDAYDALEKTQLDAWDIFIRKRKAKPTKPSVNAAPASTDPARKATADSAVAMLGHVSSNRDSICHDDNLIGVATMGSGGKAGKEDWREFKDLVRKGVPISLRPRIWTECSGATERREPGYYADLLSSHEGEHGPALTQIECDVTRTLPTNIYFGGDGPGVDKLRRVLTAMSWHNPVVGYCQGMNMVASTLLLTLPTEEDAFWVLACIIERILPSDYYTSHLLVSQADQRVLRDLVRESLPELSNHLDEFDIELPAITFGWFLSLFADALPIGSLLRVFDLFLIEGSVLLFRVALALLKLNAAEILPRDSPATLYSFMRSEMTLSCHNADRLVQVACDEFPGVKNKHVANLRSHHARQLRLEMGLA